MLKVWCGNDIRKIIEGISCTLCGYTNHMQNVMLCHAHPLPIQVVVEDTIPSIIIMLKVD